MKYPINKEFSPFSRFVPPIQNAKTAGFMGAMMKPPRWIWHDREVSVTKKFIQSYDGAEVEILLSSLTEWKGSPPALSIITAADFSSAARLRVCFTKR